jgi:hypothetical protein
MRRVHRYSRTARVELRPSQSARLRIDRSDGQPLFDFQLTTGPAGFRINEASVGEPPPGARLLHAIGDSYTMGWGVDAASSYPARLQRRLGPRTYVLNLGVDGFGAIGATGKSRALAERFPPACAVYLFSPNDLEDDVRAAAVARRPAALHLASGPSAVRRSSYVAGLPFACATVFSSGRSGAARCRGAARRRDRRRGPPAARPRSRVDPGPRPAAPFARRAAGLR